MINEPELSEADRAALQLALDQTLAEDDQGRVEQVKSKLRDDGWLATASFCAYHRQVKLLHLAPWQKPPCWLSIEEADAILADGPHTAMDGSGKDISNCAPAQLAKRMSRAGISQFHPDPIAAFAAKR